MSFYHHSVYLSNAHNDPFVIHFEAISDLCGWSRQTFRSTWRPTRCTFNKKTELKFSLGLTLSTSCFSQPQPSSCISFPPATQQLIMIKAINYLPTLSRVMINHSTKSPLRTHKDVSPGARQLLCAHRMMI